VCEGVEVSAGRQRRNPQGPWLLIYLVSAIFVVVGAAAFGYVVVDGSFGLFLLAFGAICAVVGLPIMRWVAVRIDRLRDEE
jgi:hypothetical protein